MFTGIITAVGEIVTAEERPGADLAITISTAHAMDDLALGASVACSGVCLTVVGSDADWFRVQVSQETRKRTAPAMWVPGRRLNLERALKVGDELGGHIVIGHVDGVGHIVSATPADGSLALTVAADRALAGAIAPKGSIAVDGVSLTVNAVRDEAAQTLFDLNIIPHTAQWTTLGTARPGEAVNLEIDILARYLRRMLDTRM